MKRKYNRIDMRMNVSHAQWRQTRTQRGPIEPEPTIRERLAEKYSRFEVKFNAWWEKRSKEQVLTISLFVGIAFGLFVLGWWLFPVEWDTSNWVGANYDNLPLEKRQIVLENSAELFSYTTDQGRVRELLQDWPGAVKDICFLASQVTNENEKLRLEALVYIETGELCQ